MRERIFLVQMTNGECAVFDPAYADFVLMNSAHRVDGTDAPGGKHEVCDYFVLDLTSDPFARPAIEAYIAACEAEYPLLAKDLRAKL